MNGSISEEAGKVATSTVEALKGQPGLLYLTLVNMSFLVFVYFVGTLALAAYNHQQDQIHERYSVALSLINRCMDAGLQRAGVPPQPQAQRTGH